MTRVLQRFLLWIGIALAGFGVLTLWLVIRNEIAWQEMCRGGQANPAFHSADCKDIETVRLLLTPGAMLSPGPLLLGLWQRRRRQRQTQRQRQRRG